MIRFLIGLVLVLFGCTVDTEALDRGNAVDIVTEISPADNAWHVTVVERTEISERRQRSFGLSAFLEGEAMFVNLGYAWGNASHSIQIMIVIPIPVEPVKPNREETGMQVREPGPCRISAIAILTG